MPKGALPAPACVGEESVVSRRDRLLDATRQAWQRDRTAAVPRAVRDDPSPAPGDIFVLERTASFDVEWVVLARDPTDGDRVFAVPADGLTWSGPLDFEIAASSPGGPLTLRCGFGGWFETRCFGPLERLDTLRRDDAVRAWALCQEVAGKRFGRRSVDADWDPDYRDWVESTLQPARQTLTAVSPSSSTLPPPGSPPSSRTSPPSATSWSWRAGGWLLAAAALFLAVMGGEVFRKAPEDVLIDPALAVLELDPGGVRGPGETIRLTPTTTSLWLLLIFEEGVPGKRFHVELRTQDQVPVWTGEAARQEPSEIRLPLPRSVIRQGRYELHVSGVDGEAIGVYELQIEEEKGTE